MDGSTRTDEPRNRFVILGAVQLWQGDQEIDVGGQHARYILARLLLAAGKSVSTAEMVDTLWPEEPPPTAPNMVHRVVGRLRRLLEPGLATREPGTYLVRDTSGIRLKVSSDSADLLRFRELTKRAEEARAVGGPTAALPCLVEALKLWKDSASAAVGYQLSQHPLVVALDRERLSAARDAADAALGANDPEQVLGEVWRTAEAHPYDEGLQARLMMLLAAVGQHAEGIKVFRRVEQILTNDLGVRPGNELVTAYQSLKRGQATTGPVAPARAFGRPAQLPPLLPAFVGRNAELARLVAACSGQSDTARIQVVCGMAGAGKTALAVQAAHAVAERYPDGQLYVNLRGYDDSASPLPVSEAQTFMLGSLGLRLADMPDDADARTAELRSRLWGRRVLLVLDNARDAAQVRPLLPGTPECAVIVTSRDSLSGLVAVEGAALTRLERMSEPEAIEMLLRRTAPGWADPDTSTLREIVGLCSALPLALAIVAARAAAAPHLDAADVAAQLRLSRGSLDAFSLFDSGLDMRGVFSWSYQFLSSAAARLFRLLSVHPGPHIGLSAAASLLSRSVSETRPLLEELKARQLLDEVRPSRYQMHDLLRIYSAELSREAPEDERGARLRMFNYYVRTAYAGERLINPAHWSITVAEPLPGVAVETPQTEGDVHRWRAVECQVILGLVRAAAEHSLDAYTWQLCWFLTSVLGGGSEFLEIAAAALARLGDTPMVARVLGAIGESFGHAGSIDQAEDYFDRALALWATVDDPIGLAHQHLSIGEVYRRLDRPSPAKEHVTRAEFLFAKAGDQGGVSYARSAMAWLHAVAGRLHEAVELSEQTLERFVAAGDNRGRSATLDVLGYSYLHLGDLHRARQVLTEACAAAEASDSRINHASAWLHLGDVALQLGETAEAQRAWLRTLDLARFDDLLTRQAQARLALRSGAEKDPVMQ